MVKHVIACLSSALEYLSAKQIAHRDLKLENIIIEDSLFKKSQVPDDIKVKIVDFGFAVQLKANEKTRLFCGTPCYMAPEIVNKTLYDPRIADVWALGVLLYVMVGGRFPFNSRKNHLLSAPQQKAALFANIKSGTWESIEMELHCRMLVERIFQT